MTERENPRVLSNEYCAQDGPIFNDRGMTNAVWAWGQFLDHDIDLTEGHESNGTADIPILEEDDIFGLGVIPFTRSNYELEDGIRQQINEITPFIDASNVYGSDEFRAMSLRTFEDGKMILSPDGLLPFNIDGLPNAGGPNPALFAAGDVRANENVVLTSLHTLFVREHNRLATRIKKFSPDATDDEIYHLARKIVAAEMQIITYEEFLPALLGRYAPELENYRYDPTVDPMIATEFSTATYRFGHTMLSPEIALGDGSIALRDAFFNPGFVTSKNVGLLLSGLADEQCQEIDTFIIDDVRNFLFGPPGAGGLDLASLNIQRGRDHGLPEYNDVRRAYGLWRVRRKQNMDPWLGALSERHIPGTSVGPLIAVSLIDQFRRLRDGDIHFFLNDSDLREPLVKKVINLKQVRLSWVIRRNTDEKPPKYMFLR